MIDTLENCWVRFRDLPDDIIPGLPAHVRAAFLGARKHNFEIELLAQSGSAPLHRRSKRRLVIVSNEGGTGPACGPVNFDMTALTVDVRAARRVYVLSGNISQAVLDATYDAAVADLAADYDVALIVETTGEFESSWVRTLTAMRNGGNARESV